MSLDPPSHQQTETIELARPLRPQNVVVNSGAEAAKVAFTDLDAADRWLAEIHQALVQSRLTHGDKIVSKADVASWDTFIVRWNKFRNDMTTAKIAFMSNADKSQFKDLMDEAHKLDLGLTAKGLIAPKVPYATELRSLIGAIPSRVTSTEMFAKLAAVIRCGDKLLDERSPWFAWKVSNDTKSLSNAVDAAKRMAEILTRAQKTQDAYGSGDSIYTEFLRRVSRVWTEAASLYGMPSTLPHRPITTSGNPLDLFANPLEVISMRKLVGALVFMGVGYLGLRWLAKPATLPKVAVPDAYPSHIDNEPSREEI